VEKTKDKNRRDDISILNDAISNMFSSYNREYGKIKRFKRGKYLVIVAITGGWSENEEAIAKFNKTKFGGVAPIEWWFLQEWKRGGYFEWEIPLFLVKGLNAKIEK